MPSLRRRPGTRARPLVTVALAATVTLVAAACGSGGSSGGGSGSTTLKIITWVNPPAVKAINAIDAEFMKKYPNIKVTLQTAANVNGPYQTLLQQTVNSGSADIVSSVTQLQALPLHPSRSTETPWQNWSTSGAFAALDGQSFTNSYTSDALSAETYNGHVYGIVSGEYQMGVFYDKSVFNKYHLTVPATYNQFLAVCQALKARGVQPLYTALGNVGPVYLQFMYYEAMADLWYPKAPGGNLSTALENGSVKWTDPLFVQAMNEEKAVAQYLEPNYTGVPWESMPGDFAKGKGAMLLDGSWDLASVQQANPQMQVGFFPLPFSNTAADNQPFAQNDLTFSVLNSSPNKAAAMKWLAFFSQPDIYAQYVNTTGISSSQKSGSFNGYASQVMGTWFGKGINRIVLYPNLSPSNGFYDQTTNWPTLQLNVIQGKETAAAAAAQYAKDWKTS